MIFVCNFSGTEINDFRLGVLGMGEHIVIMSTDEVRFGGSGSLTDKQRYIVDKIPSNGNKCSIIMNLPPLTAVFLKETKKSSPQLVKRAKNNAVKGGK